MIAVLNRQEKAGPLCRRFSTATVASALAAIPLAAALFALLVYLVNGLTLRDVPTEVVIVGFFAPFLALIVLAFIVYRRGFVFDEAANTLAIQGRIFFISCGQPRLFPISNIARVYVEENEIEGYSGCIFVEIEGKPLIIAEYKQRRAVWPVFQELRDMVDRRKRREYVTVDPV